MGFITYSEAHSLLYLSFLSVPTDSASFPDGCNEREVTWPLLNKWTISANDTGTQKHPQLSYTYTCALKDFKHSHVFVLHTHRRPSSPPLSKWAVDPNCRHKTVPTHTHIQLSQFSLYISTSRSTSVRSILNSIHDHRCNYCIYFFSHHHDVITLHAPFLSSCCTAVWFHLCSL